MKNTQKTESRDWLLKSLAGLLVKFIVSFAINYSKEKKEREKWVKESILPYNCRFSFDNPALLFQQKRYCN